MTFTWDFNTATLLAIFAQAVLLVVFLVRTANTAKGAMEKAEEAHKHAEEAHIKLAALSGQHMMYREHVAREYVDKDALKELKDAINSLRIRIDEFLSRWRESP